MNTYRETAKWPPTPEYIASTLAVLQTARDGDLPGLVQALLKGADINNREPETGRTAMHLAAARNDLEMVRWLSDAGRPDIAQVKALLPSIEITDSMTKNWLALSTARRSLARDHDQCLCSAMAPISTDDSERNRRATEIWQLLMREEFGANSFSVLDDPFCLLDFWKPSSVMIDAMQRYAAPLPAGYSNPMPD